MKNRFSSTLRVILVGSALFTAACAVITWRLLPIPFGRLFDTFLALAVIGLTLTMAALAWTGFGSGRRWVRAAASLPAVLAVALAAAGVIIRVDYRLIPGTSYRHGLSAEQWREDVSYFAGELPKRHIRFCEMVSPGRFEEAAKSLEENIPDLDETSIKDGIYRLAALPNDAHTFPDIYTHKLDWHSLPLKLWFFDDGLYVLDTGREHRDLIGTRLLEVGGVPVMDAYERLRPCLSHENEFNWKERFLYPLETTEFLQAEGIVDGPGPVEMTFETETGLRITEDIEPCHYVPVIYWSSLRKVGNDAPYVITNDREDNWRFEYLEDSGTLYLQFNACVDHNNGEGIEDFVSRIAEWTAQNDFERFVVDIRANGGGDSRVSRRIAGLIIGNQRIDRPGRLFVLTSRRTFSAAVMFLSLIENNTKAVIVGEPTGQGPFFCGHPRPITLPNSGLRILASRYYNRCSLFDDGREWIMPDLPVAYMAKDYFAGRDPMMEAVLDYGAPVVTGPGLSDRQMELYRGRYCLSPYQVLAVEPAGKTLRFTVDDFFDDSWRKAGSDLYPAGRNSFNTDIDGVELFFSAGPDGRAEGVVLRWRGINTYAERAPEGYMAPMELFAAGRVDEAAAAIYKQKYIYRKEVPDLERTLNRMGYAFLRDGNDSGAVKVFRLNVRLFPESYNTYDSLAEAYMVGGKREFAIKNYERVLELNPSSENARENLEHLKKGDTWDRENRRWTG